MHAEAFDWFASALQSSRPHCVLEIGARNVNGSLRDLVWADRYIGLDIEPGPDVDVIADGATYQPDEAPDCVLCAEVLEHATQAEAMCANVFRMLAPGGLFVLSMATHPRAPHSTVHGGPLGLDEFYRNVDPDDLRRWLAPFTILDLQVHRTRGDLYCVARKERTDG